MIKIHVIHSFDHVHQTFHQMIVIYVQKCNMYNSTDFPIYLHWQTDIEQIQYP